MLHIFSTMTNLKRMMSWNSRKKIKILYEVHDRTFSTELFNKGDAFSFYFNCMLYWKKSNKHLGCLLNISFFTGALKGKRGQFGFLHAGLWSKPVTLASDFLKKLFSNTKQHQVTPSSFPITNKHFQITPQVSNKCFLPGFGCIFNFWSFPQTLIGIFTVFR